MKRVLLQPAYVLHRLSYRESSFLVELWTLDYGRLTVLARGARQTKTATQGILQAFIPLWVSWSGAGELKTLSHVEVKQSQPRLRGECLFAGFYLNELLMRLLQKWDPHPRLYDHYEKTVLALQADHLEQKNLRLFEKYLLQELGYGPLPKRDFSLHNSFFPDQYYRFIPEQGFVVHDQQPRDPMAVDIFSGKSLLEMTHESWQSEDSLYDAKRLMRLMLSTLLGSRPLYSKRLFMRLDEKTRDS